MHVSLTSINTRFDVLYPISKISSFIFIIETINVEGYALESATHMAGA